MKFSTPGHGCVQEVDNIHSFIKKVFNDSKYFSLKTFKGLIENSNRKNPYKVIEMQSENFFDYQSCAKLFNYKSIPFSKVFQIRLTRNFFEDEYRLNPTSDLINANIRHYESSLEILTTIKEMNFIIQKGVKRKISYQKRREEKRYQFNDCLGSRG
jgi:hypothetical protein